MQLMDEFGAYNWQDAMEKLYQFKNQLIIYFILSLTLNGFRDSIIINEKYYH